MANLEKITILLKQAYAAFNARDMEGALSTMRVDVEWPNGMEGGTVHGREGVVELPSASPEIIVLNRSSVSGNGGATADRT